MPRALVILVTDQKEYPTKMERHFPIKPSQQTGMALTIFQSFPEFPTWDKDPVCRIQRSQVPNILVRRNRNGPFHLYSDRKFRNLWNSGKHPMSGGLPEAEGENEDLCRTRVTRALGTYMKRNKQPKQNEESAHCLLEIMLNCIFTFSSSSSCHGSTTNKY